MSELPFSGNPFSNAEATGPEEQSRQRVPPVKTTPNPPPPPPSKNQFHKKRTAPITDDIVRTKKGKTTQTGDDTSINSVAALFGSLALETFTEEDVKIWKGRKEAEEEYSFKAGLGDAFYHGLRLFRQKNEFIKVQDRAIKKLKDSAAAHDKVVNDLKIKHEDELKNQAKLLEEATTSLDSLGLEASKAKEASESKIAKLEAEARALEQSKKTAQADAFNVGFFSYLRAFLAADPEYDWSRCFASTVPAWMEKFKADNAAEIEAERVKHLEVLAKDKEAMTEAERQKGTASPSNTQAS